MTNLCWNWNKIDWKRVEYRNCRLQRQIYKASFFGNQKKVMFLQSILICSLDAKLLAVHKFAAKTFMHRGAQGQGHKKMDKPYGEDNQRFYYDASSKFRLAQNLKLNQKGDTIPINQSYSLKQGYIELKPIRRSKIVQDYVKQFWILMALEPQWEPLFDSYGFRPGRNEHYAIEYLLNIMNTKSSSRERFILKVDLIKCFDHIDHDDLLSKFHTPLIIKNQIQTWLKAGILTQFSSLQNRKMIDSVLPGALRFIETTYAAMGPFLCNVALHGLEQNLASLSLHSSKIQLVRYVDNLVIIHHDKEIVLAAKNEIFRWLKSRCAQSDPNIAIQSSREGFVFLGFRLIHIKGPAKTYRTKIYPSKNSQKEVIKKIGDFCRKNRSISTYDLISILSPIILNWANYFRFSECKAIFKKMDFLIFQILRAWVFRRDPRHGRMAIKSKYFPEGRTYMFDKRRYSDNWVLVGRQKLKNGKIDEKFLPKMAWVQSLKYQSMKTLPCWL